MTRPLHEHLYRKVLNDPDASNDERLRAARALERIAQGRRRIQKQAKAEVAAEQHPQSANREGWQIADPKPREFGREGIWTDRTAEERIAWRAIWARETKKGANVGNLDGCGGEITAWELEHCDEIPPGVEVTQ